MTNNKEILRLQSLGINNTRIAEACGCARSTVISTLQYAAAKGFIWDSVRDWSEKDVADKLLPSVAARQAYKMPDYEHVHREMQKSEATLNLLWREYCERCWSASELPCKSTQFNKYYVDYVHKTKATTGECAIYAITRAAIAPTATVKPDILHTRLIIRCLPNWRRSSSCLQTTETGPKREPPILRSSRNWSSGWIRLNRSEAKQSHDTSDSIENLRAAYEKQGATGWDVAGSGERRLHNSDRSGRMGCGNQSKTD